MTIKSAKSASILKKMSEIKMGYSIRSSYSIGMSFIGIIVQLLIGMAMLAVAVVLMAGLVSMGFDTLISEKHSNLLMRWRVILQGLAVGLMALAFLIGLA